MTKIRVHQLAKELGVEPKELLARMDKLGIRGKRAQSSLEGSEEASIRSALAEAEKPQVQVGEEKVTADRVVKGQDEILGEIQAREKVVERRVRANVIRRRTSISEVVPQAPPPPVAEPPRRDVDTSEPAILAPVEVPRPGGGEEERTAAVEAKPAPTVPPPPAEEVPGAEQAKEPLSRAAKEAEPRGARVLGRIDLRKVSEVEPKKAPPAPAAQEPGVPSPAAPAPLDR
ncbi:MAG TPA: translation initiation factor IF-2 N-terminal domain-containing protein, partial [Candidatus Binatia bacterium]